MSQLCPLPIPACFGQGVEKEKAFIICKQCSAAAKALVCYQHSLSHKCTAQRSTMWAAKEEAISIWARSITQVFKGQKENGKREELCLCLSTLSFTIKCLSFFGKTASVIWDFKKIVSASHGFQYRWMDYQIYRLKGKKESLSHCIWPSWLLCHYILIYYSVGEVRQKTTGERLDSNSSFI